MSFDQVNKNEKEAVGLFGLELGSGVTYATVAMLSLIFTRQVYMVFQVL